MELTNIQFLKIKDKQLFQSKIDNVFAIVYFYILS